MKLLLISASLSEIREAYKLGVFAGTASNPAVIARSQTTAQSLVKDYVASFKAPIFVQVTSLETSGMVEEGRRLASLAPNQVIIKIPATESGVRAIHELSQSGVPTAATAVFNPSEALLGALAGAAYVAPYYARIGDSTHDADEVLSRILDLSHIHELGTKVIAASVRSQDNLLAAYSAGAHYSAVKWSVVQEAFEDGRCRRAAEQFFEQAQSHAQEHS